MHKIIRWLFLLLLIGSLSGCFYWIRAYQTYLQMDEFDQHFMVTATDEFSLHFKNPILYSQDFISLAKLQPSSIIAIESGEKWRYWFRKVDEQGIIIQPEVKFYFDLNFNEKGLMNQWSFSQLFLQIAPAEFIEVSLRSLGGASINPGKRQLRANPDLINKISATLPNKTTVLSQLGPPLAIKDKKNKEEYKYHFLLETHNIEKGYEDRALSILKLSFDKKTNELIKMKGRFAGLKISINFRKFIKNETEELAQLSDLGNWK